MVTLAAYGAASTFLLSWALLNAFRLCAAIQDEYWPPLNLSQTRQLLLRCRLPQQVERLPPRVSSCLSSKLEHLSEPLPQIMWNFGIYCTIIFGKLMQNAFFGSLRMIEVEVCSRACIETCSGLTTNTATQ